MGDMLTSCDRGAGRRGWRWLTALWLLCAVCGGSAPLAAQSTADDAGKLDLVDGQPFDRITLDDFNNNETLDIEPLIRPLSNPLPKEDVLVFELAEEGGIQLEVPFQNLVKYQTFNDLLLEEAEKFLEKEDFARAFRNLLYVYDRTGNNRALAERINKVLFLDAAKNYETGQYGLALSMFEDLYARDPKFEIPGVPKQSLDLILDCYDRMLKEKELAADWNELRGLLAAVSAKYGEKADRLVEPWNRQVSAINRRLQDESRAALAKKDYLQARVLAGKALQVLPAEPDSLALLQEIMEAFPMLFVGVSQPAINPDPQRIDDWASRRVGRLTQRRLMELTGFSDEGGRYLFPNGRFVQTDELGMVYHFLLEDVAAGEARFGVPQLTAHELAALLLSYADPSHPDHFTPWARIVDRISVLNSTTVELRLKAPFVRPEALLQLPYSPPGAPRDPNGPYAMTDRSPERTLFRMNEARYQREPDQQFPEIVEWAYGNPSTAVEALIRGDVDVVDRIFPGELARLKATPGIEVRSYAVPTMHMLVPNMRNDFTRQAMFRIGLLRTIDRAEIIEEMICRGQRIDGSEFVDSPFPVGTEDNDQIAYAVDPTIRPAVSNYLLGQLLVMGEKKRQEDALLRKGTPNPVVPLPKLVLAHPANEIAVIACNAIATQWRQIGITTELRPLEPGQTRPPDKEYDFLYLEVACTEPLADADFLFGMKGAVPEVNATVEQVVRRVNTSSSWRQVSTNLRLLHRQTMNSVAVLPLFQLREHYAFRTNVRGIGRDLIFLYQQVERWSIGQTGGTTE